MSTTEIFNYQGVPKYVGSDINQWTWQISNAVNGILNGKTNNTGDVTLAASTAATTVTTALGMLSQNTTILFMPTTANAATEFAAGTMYVSGRSIQNDPSKDASLGANTFTITHVNNAQTDRVFKFALIG